MLTAFMFVSARLPQYIQAVQQQIERASGTSLQVFSGEMRSSQLSHLLPSVLSTRMWIKQQNSSNRTPARAMGRTPYCLGMEAGSALSKGIRQTGLEIPVTKSST